jgi:Nif-specific regulatory protein
MEQLFGSLSHDSLKLLTEASAVLNSSLDLRQVLDNIAASAAKVMYAEGGSVLLHDRPRSKLVFVSATGERSHLVLGQEFDAELGIAGRVAATGVPEIVSDVQSDAGFYRGIDEISNTKTQTLMAAPMIVENEVIGVVEVLNRIDGEFRSAELELLQVFANLAAIAARNAQKHEKLKQRHKSLCDQVLRGDQIIGESPALKEVKALCDRVARSAASVLLLGETGTGKELFAKYIHSASPRSDEPFVPVHCAALTDTLLESELFGHEKGAFTGAISQHIGRFESADGGTVFLDEIGEVPLSTQVRLLRVLQEKKFERVGGSTTISCDVRIIAATNRDLKAMIEKGEFREDLYYRLNVFPVTLPPMRKRAEDIPRLAEYFVVRTSQNMGVPSPVISPAASAMLMRHHWPGNVREIQNTMERAVLMCDGATIDVADLPQEVTGASSAVGGDKGSSSDASLWDVERAMIVKALRDAKWNQSKAARQLGISRDNLRYRIKKYEIGKSE